MNRREFLGLGLGVLAASMIPARVLAEDFRKTKPSVWKAKKPDQAIKALFGTNKMDKSGVKLNAPDIAENGAVIPITVEKVPEGTKILALFQDANPESAVAVFTIHPRSIPDGYSIRIKLQKTGNVYAVAQTKDGKLFYDEKKVKVTIGGCGG